MQSLTYTPSSTAARSTPLRHVVIAVLVALALGLWITAGVGGATPADAQPLAGHSWVG